MQSIKGMGVVLLFFLVGEAAFAACPGFQISQAQTSPFGATRYCVPSITGATYSWTVTGDLTITSGNGSCCVWVSGSCGTLSVTSHCGTSPSCSDSIEIACPCYEGDPLSVYISGDFALNIGETGTFYANPSGGGDQYTYRWYRSDTNGGQSVVGLSASYSAQYPSAGQYWVKVEVRDECGLIAVSSKFVYVGCGVGCEQ